MTAIIEPEIGLGGIKSRTRYRERLVEALTPFFETADQLEVVRRLHDEILITQIKVPAR